MFTAPWGSPADGAGTLTPWDVEGCASGDATVAALPPTGSAPPPALRQEFSTFSDTLLWVQSERSPRDVGRCRFGCPRPEAVPWPGLRGLLRLKIAYWPFSEAPAERRASPSTLPSVEASDVLFMDVKAAGLGRSSRPSPLPSLHNTQCCLGRATQPCPLTFPFGTKPAHLRMKDIIISFIMGAR